MIDPYFSLAVVVKSSRDTLLVLKLRPNTRSGESAAKTLARRHDTHVYIGGGIPC